MPVSKGSGDQVIGGTMNQSGGFVMRADKVGRDTVLARIVQMVAQAQRSRAPIQRLADQVSAWFVPAVILAAVLVVFLYATNGILSSFAWESVMLGQARLWRAAVYAVMLLPFLVGMRAIMGAWARGRWTVAATLDLGLTASILAALGVSIALNFARLSYLGILLPIIAVVMLAFIPVSAWTARVMERPTLLLGVMQALLLGWALAATLPLIT
jgi:hypothetical protein